MPYEGFETAEELSTQDIKRVVLKAFRREKAWSQSSAAPIAVKTCNILRRHRQLTSDWLRVVSSDLVALFNGRGLMFFRPSDLSSVEVYDFPGDHRFRTYHSYRGEYDHERKRFIAFAPTGRRFNCR